MSEHQNVTENRAWAREAVTVVRSQRTGCVGLRINCSRYTSQRVSPRKTGPRISESTQRSGILDGQMCGAVASNRERTPNPEVHPQAVWAAPGHCPLVSGLCKVGTEAKKLLICTRSCLSLRQSNSLYSWLFSGDSVIGRAL